MTSDATTRDRLYQGETLTPGQSLTSPDGRFNLKLRDDGKLVLSDPYRKLWESNTPKVPNVSSLRLEPEGKLILFQTISQQPQQPQQAPQLQQYWESKPDPAVDVIAPTLVLRNNGTVVVISDDGKEYWQKPDAVPQTPKPPANHDVLRPGEGFGVKDSLVSATGHFHLTLQEDGNLVEYSQNPVWQSDTTIPSKRILYVILKEDGNLVGYHASGEAVWESKTSRPGGAELKIHDNGKLAIYPVGGTNALWIASRKHKEGIRGN